MRFAAVTDLHFGRAEPFKGVARKLTGHAPALTAAFVRDMNRRVRPDFVVVLGDVIEDQNPAADLVCYETATECLAGLEMPVRYVYGNHDLVNLTHRQLLRLTGEPALNSSFDTGGWHFVRLHSTVYTVPAASPGAGMGQAAETLPPDEGPAAPSGGVELRGTVVGDHLEWLDRDLAAADLPTIVFTHFSAADLDLTGQFWFEDTPDEAMLVNRAEVRAVLESHGVAMFLNGHVHFNDHTVHNGISYVTVQSLVENATGDDRPAAAWALIEAGDRGIGITVDGRDPARFTVAHPA